MSGKIDVKGAVSAPVFVTPDRIIPKGRELCGKSMDKPQVFVYDSKTGQNLWDLSLFCVPEGCLTLFDIVYSAVQRFRRIAMRHNFFGGVCPVSHKSLTNHKTIAHMTRDPELVAISMLTCPAGPATPIVKAGDLVSVGQPIAKGNQLSCPVHASVSGRVRGLEVRPHNWGGLCPAIVIENDGLNTPWAGAPRPLDPDGLTVEALFQTIESAGIVGLGGDAHPTARKLNRAYQEHVSVLVLNAAECEPYVTADHRLLLEHCDEILRCARVIADCMGLSRVVLITEGDKVDAAELVEKRIREDKLDMELITVRTRYPLGGDRQLIQAITGHELLPRTNAMDVGCVVLNVATIYAIHQALFEGKALTHRVVTVTGGAITEPRNLWVPVGTPLRHLLDEAGQLKDGSAQLLTNGVMMGRPVVSLDTPVNKDTNSFIALDETEYKDEVETTCIRCGKCVAACPMHLSPTFIARAVRENNLTRLRKLHVEDCMSCGCCSYVCPANIPLLELVHQAETMLGKEPGAL